MLCLGLHQGYDQFGFSAFTMHDQWIPPPQPVKFVPGFVEGPAFMGYHPGRLLSHKVGANTYFDGCPAVQQGHDVGYMIPHTAIPKNWMILINSMFSKHKVMMPVTSVLIEGKPMGTYLIAYLGLICASPVSLPTGFVICLRGTVMSYLTLKDIILGLSFIAVDVALDAIWSVVVKGDKWGKLGLEKSMPAFYKKALEKIFSKTLDASNPVRIVRNILSKLADHLVKSWTVSPLVSGVIYQTAQPLVGVPRTALPTVSIGRGSNIKYTFFPGKSSGNTAN
ncbi:hypothetical protein [Nannocystis radixulma]|uniref:Uncharacterized protein n=1 Tax=Nannocystis radixulma TaxID=2995305 RepID=A0ABT5BBW8_9BACT|nr:hypothetical protein [Nannocystis radixulma]MDC0671629.1 hypothetical protein [Nannocystis radixulma]